MMRKLVHIFLLGMMLLTAGFTSGQEKERIIEWPLGTPFSPMMKGSDGRFAASDLRALEIVNILAAGKPVDLARPFQAGDDWMKGFSVRVKNVSGKRIVGARLDFSLPETKDGEGSFLASSIAYGRGETMGRGAQEERIIMPDEEFELIRTEAQYEQHRKLITEKIGDKNLSRIWLGLAWVKFEEGALWVGQAQMQNEAAK